MVAATATARMGRDGGNARCSMCSAVAAVHCAADDVFLCSACDRDVHGANIVAARHRRTRVRASAEGSCLSTAGSTTQRRPRDDAMMESWARRMGVTAWAARRTATAAGLALWAELAPAAPRMPLRVGMAAALWREVAPHCSGAHPADHALRRLEACTRVPARLIKAVAMSIGQARVKPAALDVVEGSGECS